MTALRWWAVWHAEYPEDGSLHCRARSHQEAKAQARLHPWFTTDDEPLPLRAGSVSDEEHAAWECEP